MKNIIISSVLLFFFSCSQISILSQKDRPSSVFQSKIEQIQNVYGDGDNKKALEMLAALDDKQLENVEKAKKYNFIGIIYFTNDDIKQAITNFEKARSLDYNNQELRNQILLNLASSYYKLERYDFAYNFIQEINVNAFVREEGKKFARLKLALAQKFSKDQESIEAIFYLGRDLETFNDVKQFDYLNLLKSLFSSISYPQRISFLEDNRENILSAYLAKEEAYKKMIIGDLDAVEEIISWLNSKFSHVEDVTNFIKDYRTNIKNYAQLDSNAVGIILPLTSESKERFARKTLLGIESSLNFNRKRKFELFVRDNFDNPAASAKAVRDLILNHKVSLIIGGLYSDNARAQYREARKYGVLFVSLSTVDLPRNEKGPLLIELPGSMQAQVYSLSRPDFLEKFGKRVAVLYPESNMGHLYMEELWNLHAQKDINITSVASFDPAIKDFREPIRGLLGLKFPRAREEELRLVKQINEIEDKRSYVRRKQDLAPILDFDWLFVPAYPNNAIQILPTFNFLEAKSLTFFGLPSWSTSRQLLKQHSGLGDVNLIGNVINPNDSFGQFFSARNSKRLGLLEMKGHEALSLTYELLAQSFEDRAQFTKSLINRERIKGTNGDWVLINNLWLKEMAYLNLESRGTSVIDLKAETN